MIGGKTLKTESPKKLTAINKQLQKYYKPGIPRFYSQNYFQTYDLINVVLHNQEMLECSVLKEIPKLKQPFEKDLNQILSKYYLQYINNNDTCQQVEEMIMTQQPKKKLKTFDSQLKQVYIKNQQQNNMKNNAWFDIMLPESYFSLNLLKDPKQFEKELIQLCNRNKQQPNKNQSLFQMELPQPKLYNPNQIAENQFKKQIKTKILDIFYDDLFLTGDLNFSLYASQLLYCLLEVKKEEFSNQLCADYYMNRKNMLVCEYLQKLYRKIQSIKSPGIPGKISLSLNKHSQQTIIFTAEQVTQLIIKKIPLDYQDSRFVFPNCWVLIRCGQNSFVGLAKDVLDNTRIKLQILKIPQQKVYLWGLFPRKPYINHMSNLSFLKQKPQSPDIYLMPPGTFEPLLILIKEWIREGYSVIVVCRNRQNMEKYSTQLAKGKSQLCIFGQEKGQWDRAVIESGQQSQVWSAISHSKKSILLQDWREVGWGTSQFARSKGLAIPLSYKLLSISNQSILVQSELKQFYKQPENCIGLNVQYFMHESIFEWVGSKFYNGQIRNGLKQKHFALIRGFIWPNEECRVAFINVEGVQRLYCNSIVNLKYQIQKDKFK